MQRNASSSSIGSIDVNAMEIKRENSRGRIDFDAVTKPSQKKLVISSSAGQSVIMSSENNLVAFDSFKEEKISQAASDKLLVPAAAPLRNVSMFPITGNLHTEHIDNIPALTTGGASATASISPCGNNAPAPAVASSGTSSLLPISDGDSCKERP